MCPWCVDLLKVHYYLRHSAGKQQDAFASPIPGFYLWLKYFTLAREKGLKCLVRAYTWVKWGREKPEASLYDMNSLLAKESQTIVEQQNKFHIKN